jgi:hypothetical protein
MKTPAAIATRWILIGGVSGFVLGLVARLLVPTYVPETGPMVAALVALSSCTYAATHEAFVAGLGRRDSERSG